MTELRPIRSEADYEAVAEIERLWGRKSGTPEGAGAEWRSEQVPELFDGQARIPHDPAEGVCVYGVVARDRQNADAVGHDDVFALPRDPKPGLFQGTHRVEMIDPGNLRQCQSDTSISRTCSLRSNSSTTAR